VATFRGEALDTETAFTTTALLGLITHPANMIMSIVPQAVGSLAAFERIQQYLLQPPRRDDRVLVKKDSTDQNSLAITIENIAIEGSSANGPILKDINLVVNKGSIAMCSGPVGSGKTVLAKALMGEIQTTNGKISVSSKRIGLCAQSPWLPSGTLREAICGFSPDDRTWYQEVLRMCCLNEDILTFPHGEDTQIGSRGLKLSGGQRQRVVSLEHK
jgi:ATP-binding cassette, subfamily C (CFTR/MRP), member 1